VERLKEILGVDNKPTYKVWGEFSKKILKPAIKEINEKTDIVVDFEKIKGSYGRVEELVFYVTQKKKALVATIPFRLSELLEILVEDKALEVSLGELIEALLTLKRVNPAIALWFMLHYPKGEARLYAWKHIQLTEASQDIKHPDKFLESLIKDKNPDLDWLLDQRTKDLIRKELEKLAGRETGVETKTRKLNELDLLIEEIEDLKFLMLPYEEEIAKELGIDNIDEYLDTLVKKKSIKKLKQILEDIKKIFSQKKISKWITNFLNFNLGTGPHATAKTGKLAVRISFCVTFLITLFVSFFNHLIRYLIYNFWILRSFLYELL